MTHSNASDWLSFCQVRKKICGALLFKKKWKGCMLDAGCWCAWPVAPLAAGTPGTVPLEQTQGLWVCWPSRDGHLLIKPATLPIQRVNCRFEIPEKSGCWVFLVSGFRASCSACWVGRVGLWSCRAKGKWIRGCVCHLQFWNWILPGWGLITLWRQINVQSTRQTHAGSPH